MQRTFQALSEMRKWVEFLEIIFAIQLHMWPRGTPTHSLNAFSEPRRGRALELLKISKSWLPTLDLTLINEQSSHMSCFLRTSNSASVLPGRGYEKAFNDCRGVSYAFPSAAWIQPLLLIIMILQANHLARLIRKVVRFQHRGAPLPKAAKRFHVKQLTRLPCLVVYVESQNFVD